MTRRKRRRCAGISALVTGAALKNCHAWINVTPCAAHVAPVKHLESGRAPPGRALSSVRRRAESKDLSKDGLLQSGLSPLLLASATGIFTGAIVVVLNDFVHLLQDFLLELPGGLAAAAPVLSASLVSLLLFLRGPKGLSGDSELAKLKASGGVPSTDVTEAPLRALAAGLTLAGGNSLGPESPSVEIGANVAANLAGGKAPKESQADKVLRNNLLAAGCASGIAAGFNAPIAGLFFALESVQSNYGPEEVRARGPPMQLLAAVLAATVSQLGLGSSPAVDLDFFGWVPARSLWELPFFILLGLLCGLVAASLRYLRQLWRKAFAGAEDAGVPRFLFPIVAGIVVAIVTFSEGTKEVLYKGFANVNLVLEYADGGKQPPALTGDPLLHLLILLICKVLLTAICQSSGQVGGLFAPALFMGACLGGLSGRALRDNFWPWAIDLPFFGIEKAFSVPATYAVVGMAACLGSICNVPLTSVVLLLELAGGKDYGVVLPTVAATGVAVYVDLLCKSPEMISAWRQSLSGAFSPETVDALSAEETVSKSKGLDLSEGPKGRSVLCAIPSGKVELSPESAAAVVPSSLLLEEARDELLQLGSGGCLAVVEESTETGHGDDRTQRLLGVVSLVDVDKALAEE